MPSMDLDGQPGDYRWPVVRGEPSAFIAPLYERWYGAGDARNVELNIEGRTYAATVSASKGGAIVVVPAAINFAPRTGKVHLSMTSEQTAQLTNPIYVWSLTENPGTPNARPLLISRMTVSGRAQP